MKDERFGDYAAFWRAAEDAAAAVQFPPPALYPAYRRQAAMIFSQAYTQLFVTNPARPNWVPHTGVLFPWGAPNPDTIYSFAPVESGGVYQITGRRGSEDITSIMQRRNGANTGEVHGAPLGEIDLLAEPVNDQQVYEFLLSRERPAGHAGRWHALHPEATGLTLRRVISHSAQRDGDCAIFRLDPAPPEDLAAREAKMLRFATAMNEFLLRYVQRLRERGLVNRLEPESFKENGGLKDQLYYQGLFEIGPDEALILESALPRNPRYWSVQVTDPFFSAFDFITHQSSLNGHEAQLDADGRVRFVVSTRDPGVPNWLDTAGWREGAVMWRWHAPEFPQPVVRRVKFAELRAHLPAPTPVLDATARQAALQRRAELFQFRQRW